MNCPNCNVPVLNATAQCNCGYNFTDSQVLEVLKDINYEGHFYLYISLTRLALMSILSLGLYQAYWIYKNWSFIKERENSNISPFWRGFFGIFFCQSLFQIIHDDPVLNKTEAPRFSHFALATWWFVMTIVGNMANKATDNISNVAIELIVLIITTFTFLFFIPVQQYINNVHEKLGYKNKYNLWSSGHVGCIIWGVFAWAVIISSFFN